jgi:hypothetical protein
LGIYEPDPGAQPGFNHFCFGIEKYDPDGVRVQFADVRYKR